MLHVTDTTRLSPPCFKSRPFRSPFFQFLMRSMECHRFTWRSNTVIQRSSSFFSMPELTRTFLTLTDSPDSPLYYAKNNEHQSVNFLSFLFLNHNRYQLLIHFISFHRNLLALNSSLLLFLLLPTHTRHGEIASPPSSSPAHTHTHKTQRHN